MRFSIEKDDPGYKHYTRLVRDGQDVRIFIGQKQIRNVITADDVLGYVKRYATEDRAQHSIENCMVVEEFGPVRIEIYERHAHGFER